MRACASACSFREPRTAVYSDFAPAVTDRRALAELVKSDPGVARPTLAFLKRWSCGGKSTSRSSKPLRRRTASGAMSMNSAANCWSASRPPSAKQTSSDRAPDSRRLGQLLRVLQAGVQIHRLQRVGTGADSRTTTFSRASFPKSWPTWSRSACVSPNCPHSSPPPMKRTTRTATIPVSCPTAK